LELAAREAPAALREERMQEVQVHPESSLMFHFDPQLPLSAFYLRADWLPPQEATVV
jgi:hypothetical protein